MKTILSLIITLISVSFTNGQFVAKMEIKEPIKGLCNDKDVYALLPGFGDQIMATCPLSDEEIKRRLDSAVTFLKENPKTKDIGMISLIINCNGEVVKCDMDNKTKDPILDSQIVTVFNSLGKWKAGLLNGKPVDSVRLYSFEIKKGKIIL